MSWAAMWGTSVGYEDFEDSVLIENNNGRVSRIRKETFDALFIKLDEFTAALKEDCIEYIICHPELPLETYPEWFIDAVHEGWIVRDYETYFFLDTYSEGELAMSPDGVILRNFLGDLKYMEIDEFTKHYDTLGE
jgi:hypothetical protein